MTKIQRLFRSCPLKTPGGARDAGMIALILNTGLRRSELVELDLADLHRRRRELSIRSRGKTRRGRLGQVKLDGRDVLKAWLSFRGSKPGPLFVPVNRWGAVDIRKMTDQAVYASLRKCAREAGLPDFRSRDLRHHLIGSPVDETSGGFPVRGGAEDLTISTVSPGAGRARKKKARALQPSSSRGKKKPPGKSRAAVGRYEFVQRVQAGGSLSRIAGEMNLSELEGVDLYRDVLREIEDRVRGGESVASISDKTGFSRVFIYRLVKPG